MNLKKYILGLGMMAGITSVQAQGLEGIIVERYYQANAADAAYTVAQGYSIGRWLQICSNVWKRF